MAAARGRNRTQMGQLFGVFMAGGASTLQVAPTKEGLEYTVKADQQLHYTIETSRLHYTPKDDET